MAYYKGTAGDDHIIVPASDEFDSVDALTGSDVIELGPGHTGNSHITLGDGGDTVQGGSGADFVGWSGFTSVDDTSIHTGAGDDFVALNRSSELGDNIVLDGGAGKDEFWVGGRGAFVHLGNGTALVGPEDEPGVFHEMSVLNFEGIEATLGHDILVGTDGGNVFQGFFGNDLLSGRGGTDHLDGSYDDDTLVGGRGADGLRGGSGADIFRIDRLVESLPGQEDTILDFSAGDGDGIDLSRIDADLTAAGNQAFTFIGTAAFSGIAGELRYEIRGDDLLISADADGDRVADLAVTARDLTQLAASDLIL
ncbi:calcium-binding protein [Inquilinus limosus]|uniref:Peptidase M10 serralysin C-terminal domain-containing protein n=1 Tax=Inquilinus limosus TaxID=171674 RepID=A0A211ZRN4_9PROT|nr:calcium-binding protein [Inquilinus limosus]OWJ67836.1 hypothetical protein BWR60_07630 [Inquilinus limosus]